MVGDWKGSAYDAVGRRLDYHLFLDHDGRYERSVRRDPDYSVQEVGQWEFDENGRTLWLIPDELEPAVVGRSDSHSWKVLSITTLEDSNLLLVLRAVTLAS